MTIASSVRISAAGESFARASQVEAGIAAARAGTQRARGTAPTARSGKGPSSRAPPCGTRSGPTVQALQGQARRRRVGEWQWLRAAGSGATRPEPSGSDSLPRRTRSEAWMTSRWTPVSSQPRPWREAAGSPRAQQATSSETASPARSSTSREAARWPPGARSATCASPGRRGGGRRRRRLPPGRRESLYPITRLARARMTRSQAWTTSPAGPRDIWAGPARSGCWDAASEGTCQTSGGSGR